MSCEGVPSLRASFPIQSTRIGLPDARPVHLRARVDYQTLTFSWSLDGESWQTIAAELDASLLSDEAGKGEGAQFTGAFVGVCCQDLSGTGRHADFDYFSYRPIS